MMRRLFITLVMGSLIGCDGCLSHENEEGTSVRRHMAIGHHVQTLVKTPFEVHVNADGSMRLSRLGQEPMRGKWEPIDEHTIRFTPNAVNGKSCYVVLWRQTSLSGTETLVFQVCDTAKEAKMLLGKLGRLDGAYGPKSQCAVKRLPSSAGEVPAWPLSPRTGGIRDIIKCRCCNADGV